MKKLLFIPIIAAIVLISGCAQEKPVPVINESSAQPTVSASSVTVTIQNFQFMPPAITIKQGGTVTWMNADNTPHTVTGTNNEFDSGQIQPGKTFQHTFDTSGTFEYSCLNHPTMPHGKVTVT